MKTLSQNPKKQLIHRINYIIGHMEGIKKMLAKDRYCIDIIKQNEAVVAAVDKINELILKNHLDTCVTKVIEGRDKKEKSQKLKELLELFKNKN